MTFAHITHHTEKVSETQRRIVRTTPIVRLSSMSEIVYLQGGHCWSDEGQEMELPGWAYAAMARLTPFTLKEAGYDAVPSAPTGVKVDEPTVMPPSMWQCPACEKILEEGAKEAHIAKHNARLGPEHQLGSNGKPLH